MTHGTDRRETRSVYFGQIIGCPVCNHYSGTVFGIYRKSPTAVVWRLKGWRVLHKAGDPCTPFWRTSCEVSKADMQPFHDGGAKPFGVDPVDWSIQDEEFPTPGRYIDPYLDADKFIDTYGELRWRETIARQVKTVVGDMRERR